MKGFYLSLFVSAAVIAASCDKTPAQKPAEKEDPTEQPGEKPDDPGDQPSEEDPVVVNPTITTLGAKEITAKSAVLTASLDLTDCKYDVMEYGFEVTPKDGETCTLTSSDLSEGKYSVSATLLKSSTVYSFAAYVTLDGNTFKGKGMELETEAFIVPEGAVDLGLSVCWAACNVGASRPEDYGGIYQWAGIMDVTSKEYNLYWDFCPYHEAESARAGWTKYVPSDYPSYWSGTGSPDNKLVLDPEDDVAHVKMGGKWRMPTDGEWQELIDNCTWTSRMEGGDLLGRIVTSNVSGYTDKSIYLPAAGCRDRKSWYDADHFGCYWSSSLYPYGSGSAYGIFFTSGTVYGHYECGRYGGQSVRAVIDK